MADLVADVRRRAKKEDVQVDFVRGHVAMKDEWDPSCHSCA
jgi:hypothetical protein